MALDKNIKKKPIELKITYFIFAIKTKHLYLRQVMFVEFRHIYSKQETSVILSFRLFSAINIGYFFSVISLTAYTIALYTRG